MNFVICNKHFIMNFRALNILIFILSINCVSLSSYLQRIRKEILTFQHESLILVDNSFNMIYEEFANSIESSSNSLKRASDEWKKVCDKFPYSSLNENEVRKLNNLCDIVSTFLRNIFVNIKGSLNKFHFGVIGNSFSEKVLHQLFENINQILNNHVSHLPKNNFSCNNQIVVALKSNYQYITDSIVNINTNFTQVVTVRLKTVQNYHHRVINEIDRTISKIDKCSNPGVIDTIECLNPAINHYCHSYA